MPEDLTCVEIINLYEVTSVLLEKYGYVKNILKRKKWKPNTT